MRDDAPIELTAGSAAALIYGIVFWVVLLWWIGRNNRLYPDRPASVPIALMPVGYLLLQTNPLIEYLNGLMSLRRHQRIRAFLQLADHFWMRKHLLNRRLAGRAGR